MSGASIEVRSSLSNTQSGGGSGGGLTEAEVITLINDNAPSGTLTTAQLTAVNSVINNDYLKVEDADDQYAPRARSVQIRCAASGLNGTTASAVASTFAGTYTTIDASRVTAYINGSDLRLVVSCDESNVTTVKNLLVLLDAAALEAKLPSGVAVSTSAPLSVGTTLLTKSDEPIMLYTP